MINSPRLITVSNRLPVTIGAERDGFILHQSSGGLATGLRGPHRQLDGLWIGWPGELSSLDSSRQAELASKLA